MFRLVGVVLVHVAVLTVTKIMPTDQAFSLPAVLDEQMEGAEKGAGGGKIHIFCERGTIQET